MKLELRELREDIQFLRNFCQINAGNEYGQKISKVLDYAERKIAEDNNPTTKPRSKSSNGAIQ